MMFQQFFGDKNRAETIRIANELAVIAKDLGYTQAQLALAWALANTDVSTVVVGVSKIEQIEDNMQALELYRKWNKDIEERIEQCLKN